MWEMRLNDHDCVDAVSDPAVDINHDCVDGVSDPATDNDHDC